MAKAIPLGILTTIALGLFGWGGAQILDNRDKITRVEERQKSEKELLLEVRHDVKLLLQRTK